MSSLPLIAPFSYNIPKLARPLKPKPVYANTKINIYTARELKQQKWRLMHLFLNIVNLVFYVLKHIFHC